MNNTKDILIDKYIAVCKQLDKLEQEKQEIRNLIEVDFEKPYDETKVNIFYKTVPVWKFSDEVVQAKKALKTKIDTMEDEEKINGKAIKLDDKKILNITIYEK